MRRRLIALSSQYAFPLTFLITIGLIFFPSSYTYFIQTSIGPRIENIDMAEERVVATYEENDTVFVEIAGFLVNRDNPQISRIAEVKIGVWQLNEREYEYYETSAQGDFTLVSASH